MTEERIINVEALARVEGEGALYLRVRGDTIEDLKFRIFEPPRFFEAFLRGRPYSDAPDITARICGICPIAYMMGASHAMEDALGVTVSEPVRLLRRLIYCGEWIESHVLHAFMLHAPDFLGLQDSLQLAQDKPEVVEKALQLKKLGNDIIEVVGGRAVHPVNLKVGGFYRSPDPEELEALRERLKWGAEAAEWACQLFSTFDFPPVERDYTFVALRHPDHYAIEEGRIVASTGLDIGLDEYPNHFVEEHVAHSNALHAHMEPGHLPYHVGPLARYNLNFSQLTERAKDAARAAGLGITVRNPFQSLIVRAVEVLYACEEALRLIDLYQRPEAPATPITPRAGTGFGATEAPRGLCWHTYSLDDTGHITHARIVPPTSQNQRTIEEDLFDVAQAHLNLDQEKLTWLCEQTIRNYDPCISCATHFLDLTVDRV